MHSPPPLLEVVSEWAQWARKQQANGTPEWDGGEGWLEKLSKGSSSVDRQRRSRKASPSREQLERTHKNEKHHKSMWRKTTDNGTARTCNVRENKRRYWEGYRGYSKDARGSHVSGLRLTCSFCGDTWGFDQQFPSLFPVRCDPHREDRQPWRDKETIPPKSRLENQWL